MSEKVYDVVVSGYLGVDLIPIFRKNNTPGNASDIFRPGKLTEIDGMQVTLGGVVANTGLALKRYQKKVALNGKVGNDFMGRLIREKLHEYQIGDGIRTSESASTAFGIVIAPPGIDRIFFESPGCNETFGIDDVDLEKVSQSRIFHFGYPPLLKKFFLNEGRELLNLFMQVQKVGAITSLDLSLPDGSSPSGKCDWPGIMYKVLPYTDIFVPSAEELLYIMMPSKYRQLLEEAGENDLIDHLPFDIIRSLARRIIDLGVSVVVIKMAHRGVYLLTGDVSALAEKAQLNLSTEDWSNIEMHCNAYPVDPARFRNASGAGDTAVAAFLSGIIDGMSPELTLKYTAMAGRNNLYSDDIYTDLADWEEMGIEIEADNGSPITNLKSKSIIQ